MLLPISLSGIIGVVDESPRAPVVLGGMTGRVNINNYAGYVVPRVLVRDAVKI